MPEKRTSVSIDSLSAATDYLATNEQPFFYVSRSATNLLGLDRWVNEFYFVCLHDSWGGRHPNAFSPSRIPKIEPRGNIEVANWLLKNSEVQRFIAQKTPPGRAPKVLVVMSNTETEEICESLGYELILPPVALREKLDSKIVTTQLGDKAGVLSVPNVITSVSDWADLERQSAQAQLGKNLVIQAAYGDSGRTTYFVSNESEFHRVGKNISGRIVKVMREITHLPLAVEAVVTRSGIFTGPILLEVTGHPELTDYLGGWSGSELYPTVLSPEAKSRVIAMVEAFCSQLSEEGYRGILEVSILLDLENGELYLGELNPRISGSSPHSNLALAGKTLPLFAFHLLEFSEVVLNLDPVEVREQREALLGSATVSTLVIQAPSSRPGRVLKAPKTGKYVISDEGQELTLLAEDSDWTTLDEPDQVFWFRTVGIGDYCSKGVDVGMLMLRQRVQGKNRELLPLAKSLAEVIHRDYTVLPDSKFNVYWRATVRSLRQAKRRIFNLTKHRGALEHS